MKNNCEHCGDEYTKASPQHRYCSSTCRVAAHRQRNSAGGSWAADWKSIRLASRLGAELLVDGRAPDVAAAVGQLDALQLQRLTLAALEIVAAASWGDQDKIDAMTSATRCMEGSR